MVRLGIPYHFKFFKGCLPQIFLGSFLNTLSYFCTLIKGLTKAFFIHICLKSETFAHVQFVITHKFMLFTNLSKSVPIECFNFI